MGDNHDKELQAWGEVAVKLKADLEAARQLAMRAADEAEATIEKLDADLEAAQAKLARVVEAGNSMYFELGFSMAAHTQDNNRKAASSCKEAMAAWNAAVKEVKT